METIFTMLLTAVTLYGLGVLVTKVKQRLR
ncbi:hypothetical protein U719_07665 [Exiguobacterium sp. MH3]|nr:hypothetical protein U719_07665 [Exiguobacterium sp. MH3]